MSEETEFDYDSFFNELGKKVKEEIDPETGKIPIFDENNPEKRIGWKDPITGKTEFETGIRDRGKFNKAYSYAEQKKMKRSEMAKRRVKAQKLKKVYINLKDRNNIEKEIINLTPETSISTIIDDGNIIDAVKENFEVLEVPMNGFSIIDLLDGRFEDFDDFLKENRLKRFGFPMASYYLNSTIVRGNNAVPIGKNKYATFSIETISAEDQTAFDRMMIKEVIEPNEKNKHDLLIATCNFMGYDAELTKNILSIMDGNSEMSFEKIYDLFLKERFQQYFEEDAELRKEVIKKKMQFSNDSFEKILNLIPKAKRIKDNILLNPDEEVSAGVLFDLEELLETEASEINLYDEGIKRRMVDEYIKMQKDDEHKQENYKKIIYFWDSLEQIIRSTCKTGSIKTAIKSYDSVFDDNKKKIEGFFSENPQVKPSILNYMKLVGGELEEHNKRIIYGISTINNLETEIKQKNKEIRGLRGEKIDMIRENPEIQAYQKQLMPLKNQMIPLTRSPGYKRTEKEEKRLKSLRDTIAGINRKISRVANSFDVSKKLSEEVKKHRVLTLKKEKLEKQQEELEYSLIKQKHYNFILGSFVEGNLLFKKELSDTFFKKMYNGALIADSGRMVGAIEQQGIATLADIARISDAVVYKTLKNNWMRTTDSIEKLVSANEVTKHLDEGYLKDLQSAHSNLKEFIEDAIEKQRKGNDYAGIEYSSDLITTALHYHNIQKSDKKSMDAETISRHVISYKLLDVKQKINKIHEASEKLTLSSHTVKIMKKNIGLIDSMLYDSINLLNLGDPVIINLAKSLAKQDYLEIDRSRMINGIENNNNAYVARGKRFEELESQGNFCPLGLSQKWYTPKINFTQHGIKYSRYYFGNDENRATGKEEAHKMEFSDVDNTILFRSSKYENNSLRLSFEQAEEILSEIESYALEAIRIGQREKDEVKETPAYWKRENHIYVQYDNERIYNLREFYESLKGIMQEYKFDSGSPLKLK